MTRYARYHKKFNDSEFSPSTSGASKVEKPVRQHDSEDARRGFNSRANKDRAPSAPFKSAQKICLKCRESGHSMSECPSASGVDQVFCYNCGEGEHSAKHCPLPFSNYAHALCFVCNTKGHLASACSQNERGCYPNGGCCHYCGSVRHFARNCKPTQTSQNGNEVVISASLTAGANPEDDDVHEALRRMQEEGETRKAEKKAAPLIKKKKVVTF